MIHSKGLHRCLKHLLSLAACTIQLTVFGQGIVFVVEKYPSPLTSVPGHHIDMFDLYSNKPIKTLNASAGAYPLHHEWPEGKATVFASDVDPAMANRDSHFLFNVSQATVLFASEDSEAIRTSVVFSGDLPRSFAFVGVIRKNGQRIRQNWLVVFEFEFSG